MNYKSIQDLNLIDNFLFEEALNQGEDSIEFCRILLTTILGKNFNHIKITPQRNVPGVVPSKHGIRVDAYIEADEILGKEEKSIDALDVEVSSGIYDIEPNTYKTNYEARRTRYYHSLIDSKILKSGVDYGKLKDVVVIMILPYDPFGQNRMVYTFKTMCLEDNDISYEDGRKTIYLYTKGTEGNPSQDLQDMLKYIEDTTTENATNDNLRNVHNIVNQIKMNEEVGVRYMKSWEVEAYAQQEGAKEKALEIAKNLLDILDPTTIAQKTGLTEEEVISLLEDKLRN